MGQTQGCNAVRTRGHLHLTSADDNLKSYPIDEAPGARPVLVAGRACTTQVMTGGDCSVLSHRPLLQSKSDGKIDASGGDLQHGTVVQVVDPNVAIRSSKIDCDDETDPFASRETISYSVSSM